jgi:hypothetical protein
VKPYKLAAMVEIPSDDRQRTRIGVAMVVLNTVLVLSGLSIGWAPHDEGLLAGTAERVMAGELPHVDFADTYTGGLAILNAAAFSIFGIHSTVMRLAMMPFFIGFLVATYAIALRWSRPLVAAGIATLGALLSVYNYSAPMPSWFNLFFSTMGLWAVLRGMDTGQRRWWLVAGLTAGLSMTFKVTGLYQIAAAGVALLLFTSRPGSGSLVLPGIKAAGMAVLGLAALRVSFKDDQVAAWVWHFGLPFLALPVIWGGRVWRDRGGSLREGLSALLPRLAALLVGVSIPVTLFALPYIRIGKLWALIDGVFIMPQQRLHRITMPFPDAWTALLALPLLGMWLWGEGKVRDDRVAAGVAAVLLGGVLVASSDADVARLVFWTLRQSMPMLAIAGAVILVRRRTGPALSAVLIAAVMQSLIQVPFAGPLYFLHFAPLAVLAWVALLDAQPAPPRRLHAVFMVFVLAFSAIWMGWPHLSWYRGDSVAVEPVPLGLERSNQRVPLGDVIAYTALVEEINKHVEPGDTILAMPDCPEVYFLTQTRNPTRYFYEFMASPEEYQPARMRALIASQDVKMIIFQEEMRFSLPLPPAYRAVLAEGFPNVREIALKSADPSQPPLLRFTVHWRDAP